MTAERRHEVDAIRSVALFGICVVNLPFIALPLAQALAPPAAAADYVARFAVELLFQGKFFVLFSFLFGWGFGVQLDAAARHGTAAWPRYRARLVGLLLIGAAHAVFVFAGDILMLYAVLGLALWLMRDWPVRWLVATALVGMAVAAVALMALAIVLADAPALLPAADGPGFLGGFADATARRVAALGTGLQVVLLFNGPLAFAAFCAGFAAWKSGFFEPGNAGYAWLRRSVPALALLGLCGSLLSTLATIGSLGEGLGALVGYSALAVGGPALGAVYLVAVVEASRSGLLPRAVGSIGRMSLTVYVLQGVVAGLIFYGYGLGLYGQIGHAGLVAVAVLIFLLVHLASFLWLRFSAQGPLEALLRGFMRLVSAPAPAPAR